MNSNIILLEYVKIVGHLVYINPMIYYQVLQIVVGQSV